MSNEWNRPFTNALRTCPLALLMVAVNVTDCPKTDGFRLEVTDVPALAAVMLKLLLCRLLDAV
jgi:hypothetical protein